MENRSPVGDRAGPKGESPGDLSARRSSPHPREAIRWHGGEAEGSRLAYLALPKQQQGDLLKWLQQL